MRHSFLHVVAIALVAIVVCACQDTEGELQTKVYSFADSTEYAHVALTAELPASYKGVAAQITNVLHQELDERLSRVTSYEGQRFFDPFDGDLSDNDAFMGYYFSEVLKLLSGLSQQDVEDRAKYIEEDQELTPERKAEILAAMPQWEYEYTLNKIEDTPQYVVFDSQDYIYMGGAHGGVGGDGCLTFCKKDGHLVTPFIDPEREEDIQDLLREGLVRFFAESGYEVSKDKLDEYLFIEDGHVPLPVWQPYPDKDGLVFTYQQYEIASYATGMPSFVIPFEDVAPFLTQDARRTLGI